MKKILSYIVKQLKYFFVNSFWLTWPVIVIIAISILIDAIVWYEYVNKYRDFVNITPIAYSSAVLILNIMLANILFPKEKVMSYILLGSGFLIQIFILFFLKLSIMTGV